MKTQPSEWEKIFCKQSEQEGINFQNVQTAHEGQYPKNSPMKKWVEDLNTVVSPKTT